MAFIEDTAEFFDAADFATPANYLPAAGVPIATWVIVDTSIRKDETFATSVGEHVVEISVQKQALDAARAEVCPGDTIDTLSDTGALVASFEVRELVADDGVVLTLAVHDVTA